MGKLNFLTLDAKKAFNRLRQAFIQTSILQYFDPESHIRIKIDVSGYVIDEMLSQLSTNVIPSNFGQWYPIAYFFRKIISAETWYKIHYTEFLAIIKSVKTWQHYLEGSKHKIFVLINHNNFRQFINTKSLSFCQVKWAQKLSKYYFQIDYWQDKANKAADALPGFF